jgi:uncharacterized protein YidB (DUF937 family)
MGFLDSILKTVAGAQGAGGDLGSLAGLLTKNPQILGAVASLLSTRDTAVGGSGGLGGLVGAFQKKGLGDTVAGWIATGPNPPVSAAQVTDVLGAETLGQFAAKAGVPAGEAGAVLAGLLPAVIDHLTPDGSVPRTDSLEGSIESLLSGFVG